MELVVFTMLQPIDEYYIILFFVLCPKYGVFGFTLQLSYSILYMKKFARQLYIFSSLINFPRLTAKLKNPPE